MARKSTTRIVFDRGFRRAVITDLGDQGIRLELLTLLGNGRTKLIRTRMTESRTTVIYLAEEWLGMMVRWQREAGK
jgi:hypothetical protein